MELSDFYGDLDNLDVIDWDVMKATYWSDTDDDRSYFLAVLPVHPGFLPREQVGEQVSEQVGEQVLAILEYCTEPRSKQDILIHQQLKPVYLNYKNISPGSGHDNGLKWLEKGYKMSPNWGLYPHFQTLDGPFRVGISSAWSKQIAFY